MLLSTDRHASRPTAGANFLLGNAFGFGLLDPQGHAAEESARPALAGDEAFENAVRDDLPTLVYMYWTGYVTHKPFGSEKSWAADRHARGHAAAELPHGPAAAPLRTQHPDASAPSTSRA